MTEIRDKDKAEDLNSIPEGTVTQLQIKYLSGMIEPGENDLIRIGMSNPMRNIQLKPTKYKKK